MAEAPRTHRPRIIPVLLLEQNGLLYKTVRFKNAKYVGDPRIAVKIFNDKGADEIVLLDISATRQGREPSYRLIEEIAGEAFMPLAYGGGIRSADQATRILALGAEKIIVNTRAIEDLSFLGALAREIGSQSVVASLDIKRDLLGRPAVATRSGTKKIGVDPVECARNLARAGAGEILLTAIEREGTFKGYDLELIRRIASSVDVPLIAAGGAGGLPDLRRAIVEGRAAAAAASSIFVFQGPHRAVLITFPEEDKLRALFRETR